MKYSENVIRTVNYPSPYGVLVLGSLGDRLCMCNWSAGKNRGRAEGRLQRLLGARFEQGTTDVLDLATRQLDEYFARRRKEFDVPLLFAGTQFQRAAWNELLKIPHGTTLSYGRMAARMGVPKAVRAVANANGANPISIFAPCHRVIGTDGTLTGYGGGLPAKKMLLELESDLRLAL